MAVTHREALPFGFTLELDLDENEENKIIVSHKCNDNESGEAELILVENRKGLSCLHCHWTAWLTALRL